MYNEQNSCGPPSRDVLLESSFAKNVNPLPTPKSNAALRLPPDRLCLTSCNYRLKYKRPQQSNRATYTIIPGGQVPTSQTRPVFTMNQTVMPRIQIQPGAATAPTFTMTVNSSSHAAKRKMDEWGLQHVKCINICIVWHSKWKPTDRGDWQSGIWLAQQCSCVRYLE